MDELANRIGGLGVELADVAGNLQDVAGRVSGRSDRFRHLQGAAKTMVATNRDIASDLSSPILVRGRRWGAFRVGFARRDGVDRDASRYRRCGV